MTDPSSHAVVLFASISHALRAEKIIKAQNISCKLIPVPRHLSSDCGVCLRFNLSDRNLLENILQGKLDFFEIMSL